MKNVSKKKGKLKGLIFILLILIIIIVLLIIMLSLKNEDSEETGSGIATENAEEIKPMFSEDFFLEYDGVIAEEEVYSVLTKFVYYIEDNISEIKSWSSEEKMKTEYVENEEIYVELGILDEDSFVNIMTLFQELDEEDLNFSYISFETDSIDKEYDSEYLVTNIGFKFTNQNKITIKLAVPYSDNNGETIKLIAE